ESDHVQLRPGDVAAPLRERSRPLADAPGPPLTHSRGPQVALKQARNSHRAIMGRMSTGGADTYARAAAIVARIPQGVNAEEMAGEVQSQLPAFQHLSEESRAAVIRGIHRSLRRWRGIGSGGVMPPDSDLDELRDWTRARAAEGL